MNIGARLETIGNLISPNVVIADIGTDHAYLPVWLIQQGRIVKAIAGDIVKGPWQAARNTVIMYGLEKQIEVRLGSGLSIIQSGEVDTVVIAGMGGSTMIEILDAEPEITQSVRQLVLQPMVGAAAVRRWGLQKGWCLKQEVLTEENGHLYEILVLEQGQDVVYSDIMYEIGPLLMQNKVPLLSKQIAKLQRHYDGLLNSMKKSERAQKSSNYQSIKKLRNQLEEIKDECNS